MKNETTKLTAELRQIVRATYAETSPITNQAWVVGLALQAAAKAVEISAIEAETIAETIELAQCHQDLDGQNWSDITRARNQGLIEIARILLGRKLEEVKA